MAQRKGFLVLVSLILFLMGASSITVAEDYDLQFFLGKVSAREDEVSKKERTGLLNRIDGVLGEIQKIHEKLTETLQVGEVEFRYQERRLWMSKMDSDARSIETGIQQLKLLKEKPTHLVASIQLYKSLKDLASNLNAYNNLPPFCALVGDLASEVELWADPVFYRIYLLPLANLKEAVVKPPPEVKPPSKDKKVNVKGKKPQVPPSR